MAPETDKRDARVGKDAAEDAGDRARVVEVEDEAVAAYAKLDGSSGTFNEGEVGWGPLNTEANDEVAAITAVLVESAVEPVACGAWVGSEGGGNSFGVVNGEGKVAYFWCWGRVFFDSNHHFCLDVFEK